MLPQHEDLQYCVMVDGQIGDGLGGLAIGPTEQEAWVRFNGGEEWAITRSKSYGAYVRRCAIAVINP